MPFRCSPEPCASRTASSLAWGSRSSGGPLTPPADWPTMASTPMRRRGRSPDQTCSALQHTGKGSSVTPGNSTTVSILCAVPCSALPEPSPRRGVWPGPAGEEREVHHAGCPALPAPSATGPLLSEPLGGTQAKPAVRSRARPVGYAALQGARRGWAGRLAGHCKTESSFESKDRSFDHSKDQWNACRIKGCVLRIGQFEGWI